MNASVMVSSVIIEVMFKSDSVFSGFESGLRSDETLVLLTAVPEAVTPVPLLVQLPMLPTNF